MNVKKVIVIGLVLFMAFVMIGCTKEENKSLTEDEIKFKEEFEILNHKNNDSGEGYMTVMIPEKNTVVYDEMDKILNRMENGTGIICLASYGNNESRQAIPVLVNTTINMGAEAIYYIDNQTLSSADRQALFSQIRSLLPENTTDLSDPTVIFVKDGTILGVHQGTVGSQNNTNVPLTKEEEQELSKIYSGYLYQILDIACDKSC